MVALEAYRRLAMELPGTTEQVHSGMPAFAVGKARFAIFDPKKGELALRLPLTDSVRTKAEAEGLLAAAPGRYGAEGWAGVDLERIEPERFETLLRIAHAAVKSAPASPSKPSRSRNSRP